MMEARPGGGLVVLGPPDMQGGPVAGAPDAAAG